MKKKRRERRERYKSEIGREYVGKGNVKLRLRWKIRKYRENEKNNEWRGKKGLREWRVEERDKYKGNEGNKGIKGMLGEGDEERWSEKGHREKRREGLWRNICGKIDMEWIRGEKKQVEKKGGNRMVKKNIKVKKGEKVNEERNEGWKEWRMWWGESEGKMRSWLKVEGMGEWEWIERDDDKEVVKEEKRRYKDNENWK